MGYPKCLEFDEICLENMDINLIEEKDDIFIVSASFEERASALQYYLDDDYKCKLGIIYVNEDNVAYEGSLNTIKKFLEKKCNGNLKVQMSSHRNIEKKNQAMLEIVNYCKEYINEGINITIDVTCFSRIDLIVLLDYITSYIKNSKIKIIYSSPVRHGEWLSRGYSEISNIIGFPGVFDASKSTALVVLSGFEVERPLNFIEEYEPDKIFLGVSNPAVLDEFGKRNYLVQRGLLDLSNVCEFEFSARNINECLNNLENIVTKEINNFNIVLAPLCTKMTTVASFIFARRHPEVQLAYCYPQEYNVTDYSSGIKQIFVDSINNYITFDENG